MKTIVISNRKGGSAKSTTAVNLAAQLGLTHEVLLIDFDTQGHASLGVGDGPVDEGGAHSIFLGATLSETFRPTQLHGLTLSAALELFDVYEYSDLRGVLKGRFKREKIADFFDYCIIDTPPTYDALLKNALEVADAVVVPVVPHHLGVVGVSQMMRAIFQVGTQEERIANVGILPVMYNTHLKEHRDAIGKLESSFGKEKLFSPIGVDIHLAKQFELSTPVVLDAKRTRGKNDYIQFAHELQARLTH